MEKIEKTEKYGERTEVEYFASAVAEINAAKYGAERPGFYIQTLGCQQNEADSERIAGLAVMMGYSAAGDPSEAKLIIVNTCAVREHAEIKALSLIGEYKHLKDKDPEIIIGVGGCMVTQKHRSDKLKNSYPYVNFVFDTGAVHRVPELVFNAVCGKKREFIHSDKFEITESIPTYRKVPHTAWLSVMYGCNNFCSYCIVPYVRGRERSRLPEDVISEAKELISSGAKEITLLGQNVNSYGKDISNGISFAALLRKICALDGDFRLKFMTSHPKDASDELISAIAEEEKIAKHLHLPVQSGSDRILSLMNRRYDSEKYLKIIDKLKKACPDVSITSDIIVGFPGETEEDFKATLDIIKEVRYDALFSFIFSPREGTPAARMENFVPKEVSTERFSKLLELSNAISLERNKRFVGRTLKVLAEGVSKNDSCMLTGRSDSPRPIHFKGDNSVIGEFVNVRVTEAETFSMNGETVKR